MEPNGDKVVYGGLRSTTEQRQGNESSEIIRLLSRSLVILGNTRQVIKQDGAENAEMESLTEKKCGEREREYRRGEGCRVCSVDTAAATPGAYGIRWKLGSNHCVINDVYDGAARQNLLLSTAATDDTAYSRGVDALSTLGVSRLEGS